MNINQINILLKQGKSVSEVRNILEVGKRKFQKEIKKLGYKYNQKIKQYELDTINDNSMTKVIKENNNDIKQDIILDDDNSVTTILTHRGSHKSSIIIENVYRFV